jgi:hypothetical protein
MLYISLSLPFPFTILTYKSGYLQRDSMHVINWEGARIVRLIFNLQSNVWSHMLDVLYI